MNFEFEEFQIGQILVRRKGTLCHVLDADIESELECFFRPEDARRIGLYDESGKYRPLKTAPNLRRGWLLKLQSQQEIQMALDFFYPAAIGTWEHFLNQNTKPISLRETFERQTGMYRVVNKVTNEQAKELNCSFCNHETGCIRQILWNIDTQTPAPLAVDPELLKIRWLKEGKIPTIPILCLEVCNLLVAEARVVAKRGGGEEARGG